MYKRVVEEAVGRGAIALGSLASYGDEELLFRLEERAPSRLLRGLRERRLLKRAQIFNDGTPSE